MFLLNSQQFLLNRGDLGMEERGNDQLFPTKFGISLTINHWKEFCKIRNKMYTDRMEIFTYIPCLIQSDKKGHIELSCLECADIDQAPMGEVDFDIPT